MIGHPFQFGQVNPPGQIPPMNVRTPQCGQVNTHMQIPTMNSHTSHFGQLNPLIQIQQIPVCSPSSVADCWNSAYLWFVIVHNLGAEKFDVGRLGRLTL
jgi:hypothetical protein